MKVKDFAPSHCPPVPSLLSATACRCDWEFVLVPAVCTSIVCIMDFYKSSTFALNYQVLLISNSLEELFYHAEFFCT